MVRIGNKCQRMTYRKLESEFQLDMFSCMWHLLSTETELPSLFTEESSNYGLRCNRQQTQGVLNADPQYFGKSFSVWCLLENVFIRPNGLMEFNY